ncbi:MAG: ChaN family lipoprotein [Nitrospirota bacterium]|jgi:uncharacterized iron-regulated protein
MAGGFFRKSVLPVLVLLAFVLSPGRGLAHERVLRTSDGETISREQMYKEIRDVRLVFMGEAHTYAPHHRAELEVLKALHGSRKDALAAGLEMFRSRDQKALNEWVAGELSEERFSAIYLANWGYPWRFYRQIFLYARREKVHLIGLNVPKEITEKVARDGFDSLTEEDLKGIPPVLTCNVDREYMDYIRMMYRMHGPGDKTFVHFCEAQLLWDKAMAWHVIQYLKNNPRSSVLVLAGYTHALKQGIPTQMDRMEGGYPYVVIQPLMPGMDPGELTHENADYVLIDY